MPARTTHFGFDLTRQIYANGQLDTQDKEFTRLAALDIFTDAAHIRGLVRAFAGSGDVKLDDPDEAGDGTRPEELRDPRPSDADRAELLATMRNRVSFVATERRADISDAFLSRRLHEKLVDFSSFRQS